VISLHISFIYKFEKSWGSSLGLGLADIPSQAQSPAEPSTGPGLGLASVGQARAGLGLEA